MAFKDLMKSIAPRRRTMKPAEAPEGTKGVNKILLVTDTSFFIERRKDGTLPGSLDPSVWPFSAELKDEILSKYDHILVTVADSDRKKFLETGFGDCPKVEYIPVSTKSVMSSTEDVIKKLRRCGNFRLTLPKDRRTVSWLNLQRFIDDPRIEFASGNCHVALGLAVPKVKTFMDSAKKRSRNSWV